MSNWCTFLGAVWGQGCKCKVRGKEGGSFSLLLNNFSLPELQPFFAPARKSFVEGFPCRYPRCTGTVSTCRESPLVGRGPEALTFPAYPWRGYIWVSRENKAGMLKDSGAQSCVGILRADRDHRQLHAVHVLPS